MKWILWAAGYVICMTVVGVLILIVSAYRDRRNDVEQSK